MNASVIDRSMFVESFWYWNKFSSYVVAMLAMVAVMCITTFFFQNNISYDTTLGTLSSLIEAMLGIPQLYLNYSKKNTKGLAPLLIMMWLFGDFYKLCFYYSYDSPL